MSRKDRAQGHEPDGGTALTATTTRYGDTRPGIEEAPPGKHSW